MAVKLYEGNKKKTWFVEVYLGKDERGKKDIYKKRGFDTQAEAKEHENEILYKHNKGFVVKPSDKLYSTFLDEWLTIKKDDKHGKQTHQNYVSYIKTHILPCIGNVSLANLNISHIEKLMNEMKNKGLAAGTRRKIYNILNSSVGDAVKKKLMSENVVAAVDKPKDEKKLVSVWNADTVKRFVIEAKKLSRYYMACLLPLYTGCRQGEVLGLRWSDIDFNRRVLRVTQTLSHDGKEFKSGAKSASGVRAVALSKATVTALLEHKKVIDSERVAMGNQYRDLDLVICKDNGNPVNPRDVNKTLDKLIKKLELPRITYHETRHTHASLLLLANIHPKVVSERLGHSSISITLDLYSHLLPHMQDEAVKKLDDVLDQQESAYKAAVVNIGSNTIENAFEATDEFDSILEVA